MKIRNALLEMSQRLEEMDGFGPVDRLFEISHDFAPSDLGALNCLGVQLISIYLTLCVNCCSPVRRNTLHHVLGPNGLPLLARGLGQAQGPGTKRGHQSFGRDGFRPN